MMSDGFNKMGHCINFFSGCDRNLKEICFDSRIKQSTPNGPGSRGKGWGGGCAQLSFAPFYSVQNPRP